MAKRDQVDIHSRVDRDLHEQLQSLVESDVQDGRRSLNTFLNLALRRGLREMTRAHGRRTAEASAD